MEGRIRGPRGQAWPPLSPASRTPFEVRPEGVAPPENIGILPAAAQFSHSRRSLRRLHAPRAEDGFGDGLEIVGIDEDGAILQLFGRSRKFTQDQDTWRAGL